MKLRPSLENQSLPFQEPSDRMKVVSSAPGEEQARGLSRSTLDRRKSASSIWSSVDEDATTIPPKLCPLALPAILVPRRPFLTLLALRPRTLSRQSTLSSFFTTPTAPRPMPLKRPASSSSSAPAKKAKAAPQVDPEVAAEMANTPLAKLYGAMEEAAKVKAIAAGKEGVVVYWMRYVLLRGARGLVADSGAQEQGPTPHR